MNKQIGAYVGTVLARKGRMETHRNTLETQKPKLRQIHEKQWLVTYVVAVLSPNRTEGAVFWIIFDVFGPILATFCGPGAIW